MLERLGLCQGRGRRASCSPAGLFGAVWVFIQAKSQWCTQVLARVFSVLPIAWFMGIFSFSASDSERSQQDLPRDGGTWVRLQFCFSAAASLLALLLSTMKTPLGAEKGS